MEMASRYVVLRSKNYSSVRVIAMKSNVVLCACCKRSIPRFPSKNLLASPVGFNRTPAGLRTTGYPPIRKFNEGRVAASMYLRLPIDKSEGVVKDKDLLCSAEHRVFARRLRTKTL